MAQASQPSDPKIEARATLAAERAKVAADRAKTAAVDSARWLHDEAGRLWADYRKQSKFFKWRAWIVVAFSLVTIFSVAMATRPQWSNGIQAQVIATAGDLGGLNIYVENNSTEAWTHVVLVLDGAYRFKQDKVAPTSRSMPFVVNTTQFAKANAETPGPGYRPRTLEVECDQGSYTYAFGTP